MKQNFLDTQAIEKLIYTYLDAVYQTDIPRLQAIFHPNAAMYGDLGGNLVVGTPQIFLDDIGSKPSMKSTGTDCRGVIKLLQVTGNVANVTLYVDGFYGTATVEDHFHLLKEGGNWRIVCKTFTTI